MAAQTFNISLPAELVAQIDEQASREFASRSEYIRRAVVKQLRTEQALQQVLDSANERGRRLGFTSEQQVYDALNA
jgi:metal-responsive CopG/Arc/MetJ family transcriptional regulator